MSEDNSRRDFLKKSAVLALGTIASGSIINDALAGNQFVKKETFLTEAGTFKLPELPYKYDALEPYIDAMTMEIHHTKHHQAYVTNLNKALESVDSSLTGTSPSLEKILQVIDKMPMAVRNNAGGHYNHSLFWTLLKRKGGKEPVGKLGEEIKQVYSSYEEFKKQFTEASMKRFGSGWTWLVANQGRIAICTTANQENPLMNLESVERKGTPVLALDVWEHAYYLKYQNKRADYIESFWNVINWEMADQLYTAAK